MQLHMHDCVCASVCCLFIWHIYRMRIRNFFMMSSAHGAKWLNFCPDLKWLPARAQWMKRGKKAGRGRAGQKLAPQVHTIYYYYFFFLQAGVAHFVVRVDLFKNLSLFTWLTYDHRVRYFELLKGFTVVFLIMLS